MSLTFVGREVSGKPQGKILYVKKCKSVGGPKEVILRTDTGLDTVPDFTQLMDGSR